MFKKVLMLCYLFIALFWASSSAIGKPIDMIAATVGEELIIAGEVVAESKIMAILAAADASVSLPVPGAFSRETLDIIINRKLVSREAVKFQRTERATDSLDELLAFEKKFTHIEELTVFLKQEGLTAEDLAKRFVLERVSAAFLAEKIALSVHVTAKETEAFYSQNKALFSGKKLPEAEPEIRAILVNRKSGRFLEDWLDGLKARGKIKYFKLPSPEESE